MILSGGDPLSLADHKLAELTDALHKHLTLYGVEPKRLDVGIGLSAEVEAGMEKVISAVVEQLRHSGYEVKRNGIESEH